MQFPVVIFVSLVLFGCQPEPNIDSEYFRAEYTAAVEALRYHGGHVYRDLDEIDFFIEDSMEGMQKHCDTPPCAGNYDRGLITLPPLPESKCGLLEGGHYAKLVIHEILHAQQLDHGSYMDQVIQTAWPTFARAHCPHAWNHMSYETQLKAVPIDDPYEDRIGQDYTDTRGQDALVIAWTQKGLPLTQECVHRAWQAPAHFADVQEMEDRCPLGAWACTLNAGEEDSEILIRYSDPDWKVTYVHEMIHILEMCLGDHYQDVKSVRHERPEIWGEWGSVLSIVNELMED